MSQSRTSRTVVHLLVAVMGIVNVTHVQVGAQGQPVTADERKYRPERPNLEALGVEVLPVQGSVHLVTTGRGSNIVVQAGAQGAFLVDGGPADVSEQVLAEIRALTRGPIKGLASTTTDPDHVGGNARLVAAGQPMYLGSVGVGTMPQAQIFAHEKALNQMSAPTGQSSPVPPASWPTDTFVGDKKKLFFNGEPIELQYSPGHTDGDIIVWFRRSDVVATGDLFTTTSFPRFDPSRGGRFQDVLDGLNHVVDLAVAEFNQQGGTRIVPGHGRISNQSDVVEYRDMATIVRDRVRAAVSAGRTLEQIQAARVTLEYDGVYGTPTYTGAMFVEAVYIDSMRSVSSQLR